MLREAMFSSEPRTLCTVMSGMHGTHKVFSNAYWSNNGNRYYCTDTKQVPYSMHISRYQYLSLYLRIRAKLVT